MEINTQYFGTVECSEKEFIHFPEGLFGFPDLKDYVPLAFQDNSDALLCLQSAEDFGVSFIIMNPFLFYGEYAPVLSSEDRRYLKVSRKDDTISYYVICVIHESMEESTVNLKCPIAVNTENRTARQVILDDSRYNMRHSLKDFTKKGD